MARASSTSPAFPTASDTAAVWGLEQKTRHRGQACEPSRRARVEVHLARHERDPEREQDGPDVDPKKGGTLHQSHIANGKDGLVAGFNYLDLTGAERITVRVCGSAEGTLFARTDPKGEPLTQFGLCPSRDWKAFTA